MRVLCALGLFLALLHVSSCLLLGAFNVQAFGKKKSSDQTLMDIITTIVRRYDIILIQEVRDSDLSVTQAIVDYVNRGSPQFKYIVSDQLGPSTYKERYLFLYRYQTVSVVGAYTYAGTATFNRPPFIVRFSSTSTAVKDFVLIPQHTCPTLAVKEVDALYDVVADVRTRWATNDTVLLGDFNAGCSYIKQSDWQKIRLFTDKNFHWLITDAADTTVSGRNCPYDRIVATSDMMRGVVSGSAQVYNFMTALQLNRSLALAVSDHFPVQVQLN